MKATIPRELIKFRAAAEIRKALKLRAARDDSNMTQVILDALAVHLTEQLREVRQRPVSAGTELHALAPRRKA